MDRFPVTSVCLRRHERDALWAIYDFARLVDDLGDEADTDRLAALGDAEDELRSALSVGSGHPVFASLARVVRAYDLPVDELEALIAANRTDQSVCRYQRFDDLLAYCRLSANPIGRLALHVFGCADECRIELADRLSTGLQLAEHLGDIDEDLARGRLYVPQEDFRRSGSAPGPVRGPSWTDVIRFEVDRARGYVDAGVELARCVPWRLRPFVVALVGAGNSMLDAVEHELGSRRPASDAYRRLRAARRAGEATLAMLSMRPRRHGP